jgi:hypothetical protein
MRVTLLITELPKIWRDGVPGHVWSDTVIMLDTQASVHIISSPTIASQIMDTELPVMIQGITGDRVRVKKQATIKSLNITGYYSPEMKANIISYYKLKEMHNVNYDDQLDTFTAIPYAGPTSKFVPVNGHYIMDLATTVKSFMVNVKSLRYSGRQLTTASNQNGIFELQISCRDSTKRQYERIEFYKS